MWWRWGGVVKKKTFSLEEEKFLIKSYLNLHCTLYIAHCTFLLKSWFFGMQQFSFNPAGIFSLKDTLKIYKGKKICKISKPSGSSLNPLFKKECHLLSDKLESMEIKTPSGFNDFNLSESKWHSFIKKGFNNKPEGLLILLIF